MSVSRCASTARSTRRSIATCGSISDFIQVEPDGGQAATERTETWVAFDDDHVYVSFKVWDSDMDTLIATEMRRDSTNSWQGNDLVSFIFDTFYDRRTSFTFTMNPLGGRSDGTMVNDRQYSSDWNPVWETKTARFDGGWAVEAAVPFKSLRYQPGTAQVWGFNAMRVKRSKNEVSTLTRVPPATGQSGFQRAQFAATLVGIEAPRERSQPGRQAVRDLEPDDRSESSRRGSRTIRRPRPAST